MATTNLVIPEEFMVQRTARTGFLSGRLVYDPSVFMPVSGDVIRCNVVGGLWCSYCKDKLGYFSHEDATCTNMLYRMLQEAPATWREIAYLIVLESLIHKGTRNLQKAVASWHIAHAPYIKFVGGAWDGLPDMIREMANSEVAMNNMRKHLKVLRSLQPSSQAQLLLRMWHVPDAISYVIPPLHPSRVKRHLAPFSMRLPLGFSSTRFTKNRSSESHGRAHE